MHLNFRDYHTITFLQLWKAPNQEEPSSQALDKSLYLYFKENKAIGSKDRQEISQNVYRLIRWRLKIKALLKTRSKETLTWHDYFFESQDIDLNVFYDEITPAENLSLPQELYELLVESLGEKSTEKVALNSNQPAPVFLRVNRVKTTREKLLQELPPEWKAQPGPLEDSIVLLKKAALFQSTFFQQGHFEMQDLSSQKINLLVDVKAGDHVLDYCAGAGGKSLGIAPKLEGKGQIYLHDIREWALDEAKIRLRRAGIQNFQLLKQESPFQKKLKQKMDWVLVDAPCSGSGTLRRNPDMKEKIDRHQVKELAGLQRHIFEKALSFVKEDGFIVYATCSILRPENEEQIEHFLKTYPLKPVGSPLQTLPEPGLGDGFFGMVMQKQKSTRPL